jgi:hypothetical protein
MFRPTRSFLWLLVLVALCAAAPVAFAAELGNVTVYTRSGQLLNAHIEIVSLEPDEDRTLVARLASRDAFREAGIDFQPELADLLFTIERRAGRAWVWVRSTRAIQEPFLRILLELRSSRGVDIREYTLLLDPRARPPQPTAKPAAPTAPTDKPPVPTTRDELFGLPRAEAPRDPQAKEPIPERRVEWRGFVQNYSAYDYKDPSHWSRAVIRTQLGAQGGGANVKWKATARLDVDPVYAGSDFYPHEVRRDQRRDFFIRETYLDTSAGGFEFRLGKQNIVWGEMVGLFFADVVSARDQRDFILPEFEIIRIPQWALRAERFGENYHAEVIWLPSPEVDNIGKPGAEFFPFQTPPPAGFSQQFNNVDRPARERRKSNFGVRASTLRTGWDLSAFYYRSTDVNPTFYRDVVLVPAPTLVYTPRHDRIQQFGGTLGKDLGPMVAKAEMIYTSGRKHNVSRLTAPDGLVEKDTLDYVAGLDFTFARSTRLNLQFFTRVFRDHDPDLLQEAREGGVSLLFSTRIGAGLEPELLVIQSVNRRDRLVRTKLGWSPQKSWRLAFGVDVFTGPVSGFFGRFDDNDRAYVELRYDF